MNTPANTNDQTSPAKGRRPTNRLWFVQGEGDTATWTEIAGLWPIKAGNGLYANLKQPMPVLLNGNDGRLIVLPAKFKPEQPSEGGKQ
jgi:hypothetical protein